MKTPITVIALLTTTILPFASAWRIQLYNKELYVDRIHNRDGWVGQPCKSLGDNADKAESMKWESGWAPTCGIRLYNGHDCTGELGDSGFSNWNLPAFSTNAKNKVASYKIYC